MGGVGGGEEKALVRLNWVKVVWKGLKKTLAFDHPKVGRCPKGILVPNPSLQVFFHYF